MSNFYLLFNNEKKYAETETNINFISYSWDDDHIQRFEENNWQCLCWNKIFQVINDTKDIAHLMGKKGMHIKVFYAYMDKDNVRIYQDINHFKQA